MTAVVVGAGNRGKVYSAYSETYGDDFRVVAVCEPKKLVRNAFVDKDKIAPDLQVNSWEDAAATGKRLADIAIITTPDALHCKPAVAFAKLGSVWPLC